MMRNRQRAATWLLAAAIAAALTAHAAGAGGGAAELKTAVDAILSSGDLKGAAVGARIIEMPEGRVLYSYHAEDTLMPASNAKVVTTAAALDLLGGKWELTTTLVARGEVRDGVLHGDMVLVGRGDPSMSTHWTADVMTAFRRFAAEASASGIRAVTGDVIADDLYFDREYWCPSWPGDQWIHWYEAPVSALALNDNCVDVTVGPGALGGAAAAVGYYPATGLVTIANRIVTTTDRKKHGYAFYRGKYDNNVTAKGYYYLKSEKVDDNFTVYDPALFAAAGLKKALEAAGIKVSGGVRHMAAAEQKPPGSAQVIAVNRVSLAEVVKYCNLNSQNLYAEMILKTLGREATGSGSFTGGAAAVSRFVTKLGIQSGTYAVADGSGLSRETKYSALILTEALKYMYSNENIVAFRDSLPLAGYNGTLEGRLEDPEYRGKVRAKTGYILGASALSGYAQTANGKTVAFSLLFNNFKGSNRGTIRPIQDKICKAMIDSAP